MDREFSVDRVPDPSTLHIEFEGEIWYWRGPSPYRFVTVPDEGCVDVVPIKDVVRKAEGLTEGDVVAVALTIRS